MILNPCNDKLRRSEIAQKIKDSDYKTVLNVGGSLGAEEFDFVTHYADLRLPQFSTRKHTFIVDISNPLTWDELYLFVLRQGKFDYAFCTQTLEHVSNIRCAIEFLQRFANEGFISVPSKYTELKKGVSFSDEGLSRCNVSNHFRGFHCHKWIFTIKDSDLWAFPKLNFVDYMNLPWVDNWPYTYELSFEWENNIPLVEIDDSYLDFPDPEKAIKFYYEHLERGL